MRPTTGYIDPMTGAVIGAGQAPATTTASPNIAMADPLGTATSAPASYAMPGNDGMVAASGWAGQQGYTPEMLESIYQNPWFLLKDVFKGIETSSPGYAALRDFGADPLSLFSIMEGSNRLTANDEGGAASSFANFLNNLYTQLGTSGGKELSAKELLGNIFGQKEFGAKAQSDLGSLLGQGDASTQIRTLFNLLRDVAGSAMNPLAASAYMGSLQQAGDDYGNQMLRTSAGDTQNPVQYLNERYPWLTGQAPR